ARRFVATEERARAERDHGWPSVIVSPFERLLRYGGIGICQGWPLAPRAQDRPGICADGEKRNDRCAGIGARRIRMQITFAVAEARLDSESADSRETASHRERRAPRGAVRDQHPAHDPFVDDACG